MAVLHFIGFARRIGLSRNVSPSDVIGRHVANLLRQNAVLAAIFFLLYPSAAKADAGQDNFGNLLLLLLLFGLLFLYFLPSIIAFRRAPKSMGNSCPQSLLRLDYYRLGHLPDLGNQSRPSLSGT